jgi:type II secretory pathway pseudopilin PulG
MRVLSKGFTLVETLIASVVLVVFFLGVAIILQTGIQAIGMAKLRSEASHLANQRLEMARNLSYENVGTVGGIPAGSLPATEQVNVNGMLFSVVTTVLYVDDVFDGIAPTDLLPIDYKRVRVSVSWQGAMPSKTPVVLLSDIAPKGLETIIGGGTLSVLVFDSQGLPVPNALVHIEASSLTPQVLLDITTDDFGRVILPGAPICVECYQISATKTGYTVERTYGTNEVINPYKPHVSVLQSRVSEVSFSIDHMATLTIKATRSKLSNYAPFMGVQMLVRGTKEIGKDDQDDPVYKVDLLPVTGAGGIVVLNNLEWDTYSIGLPPSSSVDFAGSWPFSPITLNPGDAVNFVLVVESASPNTLLVRLENEAHSLLDLATVELSRTGFIATDSTGTQSTGDWSQAFFTGLTSGIYDVAIRALGYETATASVSIAGDISELFIMATASASPSPTP